MSHSTFELAEVRVRLRKDLRWVRHETAGTGERDAITGKAAERTESFIVEDDTTGRFYRVGRREYALLSLLDGRTTVSQAVARLSSTMGKEALSEEDAATICRWAIESGLAETEQSRSFGRLSAEANKAAGRKTWEKLNPISIRIPLGNPQRMIEWLLPLGGWMYGVWGFALWLVVIAGGATAVGTYWHEWQSPELSVWTRHDWFSLGVVAVVLRVIHEFSHGLCCTRQGGRARDAGIVFMMFAPMPYVDVSSSWTFRSKWARMQTAFAGVYAELFLASLAAVGWGTTHSPVIRQILYHVMVSAGFVTVVFNANPLMRFDGYYLLSDYLEIHNLGPRGQAWVRSMWRWLFMGRKPEAQAVGRKQYAIIAAYGVLAGLWRITVNASLLVMAAKMFRGAGIVLAIGSGLTWYGPPLLRMFKYLVQGSETDQPPRGRITVVSAVMLTAMIAGFGWLRITQTVTAPAVVMYRNPEVMRLSVPGFVREILVHEGQRVAVGDLLIRLENPQISAQRDEIRIELDKSNQKAGAYLQEGNLPSLEEQNAQSSALTKKLEQLDEQLARLNVIAPTAGWVVANRLDEMAGRYLTPGATVLTIADEADKEVLALLDPRQVATSQETANSPVSPLVDVLIDGDCRDLSGTLRQIDPRAISDAPHPALTVTGGGYLAVKRPMTGQDSHSLSPVKVPGDQMFGEQSENAQLPQLLSPRILARVNLAPATALTLSAGQTAQVHFPGARHTVGDYLWQKLEVWYENKTTQ